MMRTKIVHIINSFEFGGAEVMLGNLLARTDRGRFEPVVVSLIDDLRLADGILASGIPVRVVGMKPGILDPLAVARLARLLRSRAASSHPDVDGSLELHRRRSRCGSPSGPARWSGGSIIPNTSGE